MTRHWNGSDDEPTPEEFADFLDGGLEPARRAGIEAWLADDPDVAADREDGDRLTRLFRDHPPPEPEPPSWRTTLAAVHRRLDAEHLPRPRRAPGYLRLVLGLAAAAAAIGGVLLTRSLVPTGNPGVEGRSAHVLPGSEDDGPYPVASAGEVNIISMQVSDADSIATDQPILGSFELARPEDIELVRVRACRLCGRSARLDPGPVPMLVVDARGPEEP